MLNYLNDLDKWRKNKEKPMENDSRLKLNGFILDFVIWDDTINPFVMKFHDKYNVYPNILLASDDTYRRIDLFAQKHPERIIKFDEDGNMENIETSEDTYDGLSMFTAEDYELECYIDYDLQKGYFMLVLDEEPDFSGEPIIDDEKEVERKIYAFRKSA